MKTTVKSTDNYNLKRGVTMEILPIISDKTKNAKLYKTLPDVYYIFKHSFS